MFNKVSSKALQTVVLFVIGLFLVACSSKDTSEDLYGEKVAMKVAALKGPTGMGLVQLMEEDSKEKTKIDYDFQLLGSPDEMAAKIISQEVDVAAVPANLALTLYNKTEGKIQLLGVNTLGVLYILENGESVQSIEDLKGKTIFTSGKGASQDFVFRYILQKNGIDPEKDVILEYQLEQADLAAAMVEGDAALGILPQPHVTTTMMKNPEVRIALDVTREWNKVTDGAELATGVIIVQKTFAQENPEALAKFMKEYQESVDFINEELDEAAALVEKYEILPSAAIAKNAIPLSNIVLIEAQESKDFLEKFYQILFEFEPKSVGGKLADEGFYYQP